MWNDLAVGPKVALVISIVIATAVVVGFMLHWIRLWKLRK